MFEKMAQSIGPRLYSCCNCRNHVGLHDDIISKAFQVRINFIIPFVLLVSLMVYVERELSGESH